MIEVNIGPYSEYSPYFKGDNGEYRLPAKDIRFLLQLANINLDDCIFSGHASENLDNKSNTDLEAEYGEMPPEAMDDSMIFYFASDLEGTETQNPLWYAFTSTHETGEPPRIDVISIAALQANVTSALLDFEIMVAYLTPEELEGALVGRFVIELDTEED